MPGHNIKFIGTRSVKLNVSSYEGVSFHETAGDPDWMGIVACFRNEPIYQETITPIRNARAHLKLFDLDEKEIGSGISRAHWLGEKMDLLDLVPGGKSGCVLAIIASKDKIIVPSKQRTASWMGEGLKEAPVELSSLPSIVEVSLFDGNNQLLLPPVRLKLRSENGKLEASTIQSSGPSAKAEEKAQRKADVKAATRTAHLETARTPWTRDQVIAVVVGALTLIGIVVAVATPEIRRKIGLEKTEQARHETSHSTQPTSSEPRTQPPASNSHSEISLSYNLESLPIRVSPRSRAYVLGLNKGLNSRFNIAQFYSVGNGNADKEKLWPDPTIVEREKVKPNNSVNVWRFDITNHGERNILDVQIPLRITYGLGADSPWHVSAVVLNSLDRGKTFTFYTVNDCPVAARILIPRSGYARTVGQQATARFQSFELGLEGPQTFANVEMDRSLTNWTANPCIN